MTVQIPLSRGMFALIDDEDLPLVAKYRWHAQSRGLLNYARGWVDAPSGKRVKTLMHRLIIGVTDPACFCDHRDGNGLNNSRENLRLCTNAENLRNRGRQSTNTSGFKGVHWDRFEKKWRAIIGVANHKYPLGRFNDPESAYLAYCRAAAELHGEFARIE